MPGRIPLAGICQPLTGKCRHNILRVKTLDEVSRSRAYGEMTPRYVVRTTPQRSALMKRVRQRGTDVELAARKALSEIGSSYRLNVNTLPGSPDMANERRRKAVFVHGCFWHGHSRCGRGRIPMTNRRFWLDKLRRNKQRDTRKISALRRLGFDVLVVWECELEHPERVKRRMKAFWNRPFARHVGGR